MVGLLNHIDVRRAFVCVYVFRQHIYILLIYVFFIPFSLIKYNIIRILKWQWQNNSGILTMALITMVRLNYTNLIFETDCKELVQALYEKNGHPNIHVYIQDIHHLLAKMGHHRIVSRTSPTHCYFYLYNSIQRWNFSNPPQFILL